MRVKKCEAGPEEKSRVEAIDWRGYDEQGIHYIWRSFSERARLDADAGDHDNQVMWRYGTGLTPPLSSGIMQTSLTVMDTWMTSLMSAAPKTLVNGTRAHTDVEAGNGTRLLLPDERHDVLDQDHRLHGHRLHGL
jgi:hypothetical protein